MDDLISRQAAIDALNGELTVTGWENAKTIQNYIKGVDKKLRELPSAERHGRWIIYAVSPWDGEDVKCSVCGEKGCAPYWDYCPHCGSRMDLEGEKE